MHLISTVRKCLGTLSFKRSSSSSRSSKCSSKTLEQPIQSSLISIKSQYSRLLKQEAEDLDRLRRQPEWVEVQILFRKRLFEIQERMVARGITEAQLSELSIRGACYRELLEWSLKEPEGGASELEMV